MEKTSGKRAVVFGVILVAALGLVTVGFTVFRNGIGGGSLCFALDEQSAGSFGGIGIEITMKEGQVTVVSALEGKAAEKAGIKAGDRIIKINDEAVGEVSQIEDVVPKLRGEPGTEVAITVQRGDETKAFTLTREKIEVPQPKMRIIEQKAPRVRKPGPGEKVCPRCGWTGDERAVFCPMCGYSWRRAWLWGPFEQEWPQMWRGDEQALEQYQEALRRLREAERDVWRSFPRRGLLWDRGLPQGPMATPQGPPTEQAFRMDMDVSETDEAITIKCDMPGMKKEDIDVTLKGEVLTIKGKREVQEETKDKEGRVVRRERSFGSFSRSFTVPEGVKSDEIKTSYKDGVLTIVVPKEKPKPEKKEKVIKIGVDTI